MRVAAIMDDSRANGPGSRLVVWLQGCRKNCPGCCNQEMRAHNRGALIPLRVMESIVSGAFSHGMEGITFTGGEPLDQAAVVLPLVRFIRRNLVRFSVLIFTGYTRRELEDSGDCDALLCWEMSDVVVSGPYKENLPVDPGSPVHGVLSSSNQRLCLNSGRYSEEDFREIVDKEVVIDQEGAVFTGVGRL